jgi:3-hydroxy-9,10-secoandrosta-1,3,5(10)-triene-9,17-dione monooxygenase reductase component
MTAPVDMRRYRETIGHFATGVAIVTAQGERGPAGMTANALCSLSLDPLLLLVCFERSARTLPLVGESGRFAVNILRYEQHALSGVFASKLPEREKFAGVPWHPHEGAPVLDEALAWLVCELCETHPGGDHTICIGVVLDLHHSPGGRPLVWYRGRYGTLTDEVPAEAQLPN